MIMMQYDVSILTAFALYLLVMLAIGVYLFPGPSNG